MTWALAVAMRIQRCEWILKNKVEVTRLADCPAMEGRRGAGVEWIPRFLT